MKPLQPKITKERKNDHLVFARFQLGQSIILDEKLINIVLEYVKLSTRTELSEKEAERMDEILALIERNETLTLLVNIIDEIILEEQNFLTEDNFYHYKNQIHRVKEFLEVALENGNNQECLEPDADLNDKCLTITAPTLEQQQIIKEYANLANRSELSDSEAERIGEILELSESDEVLSFFINEIDYLNFQELNLLSKDNISKYENQIARIIELLDIEFDTQQRPIEKDISEDIENRSDYLDRWDELKQLQKVGDSYTCHLLPFTLSARNFLTNDEFLKSFPKRLLKKSTNFQILVLGASGVGKSKLINLLFEDKNISCTNDTVSNSITLIDTPGVGEYKNSDVYLNTCSVLGINRYVCDRFREIITLNNLGTNYRDKGEYEKALAFYQQALTISQKINNNSKKGQILNNLGLVCSFSNRYAEALEYFEQALAINRDVSNCSEEVINPNSIGTVSKDERGYEKTLALYQQALCLRVCIPTLDITWRMGDKSDNYLLEDFAESSCDKTLSEKDVVTLEELFENQKNNWIDAVIYVFSSQIFFDTNEQKYLRKFLEYQKRIKKINKIIFVLNIEESTYEIYKPNREFLQYFQKKLTEIYQDFYPETPPVFEVDTLNGTGINKLIEAINQILPWGQFSNMQLSQKHIDKSPKDFSNLDNITVQQKHIIKEYAKLASRTELSDSEAERIGEILELSESDEVLSFFINEIDHLNFQELNLLSKDNISKYENQIARILELIECKPEQQKMDDCYTGTLDSQLKISNVKQIQKNSILVVKEVQTIY
ncbi:MAG: tetratricopeptide repeat protein [Crinalium sp.]